MESKRERLIFLESMAKRLVKAVGPLYRASLCVGYEYTNDHEAWGLPPREGGYGLVSVLLRPGRKHVTFAGDRKLARSVEAVLTGELGQHGKFPSLNSEDFDFFREGWEPEWSDKAAAGSWEPVRPIGEAA
ncbi:hypothetical protein ACX80I_12610 [Arthrobacter sp. MDT3-44]